MTKQDALKQQIELWKKEADPLNRWSRWYSLFRVVAVLMAVIMAIYADQKQRFDGFVLAALFCLLFAILVYRHHHLQQRLRRYEAMIAVNEKLLRRCDDTWKQETNDNSCPEDDTLSYDLDLLGQNSLYSYLNMTATPFGKKRLISLLLGKEDQTEAIQSRQAAILELLEQKELLLTLESNSMLFAQNSRKFKDADLELLVAYAKTQEPLFSRCFIWLSRGMSLFTIGTALLALLHILPYGYCATGMLVNLIVSFWIGQRCAHTLSFTKDLARVLKDYAIVFQTMENAVFTSPLLKQIQQSMMEGCQGLRYLQRIMDVLALRHNLISYVMFGALCQLDVQCVVLLQWWRKRHGKHIAQWLSACGELEALASMCVLAQVKETFCFPEIVTEGELIYELKDGFHPLIQEGKAVANSVSFTQGSVIITGSNMSGKTTFLRMLGITMMLCRAGAPVCATAMRASCLQVFTSMRIKDDVTEGISTFYAELLRIKAMMDASKKKQPMLVLIDEIFKGTNSADRILCAKMAIAKLHLPWVITLVSTHDFELCDCEVDPLLHASNYHFSEYYVNDEIRFDYLLKQGRCTSTNAKELMRLAGIC